MLLLLLWGFFKFVWSLVRREFFAGWHNPEWRSCGSGDSEDKCVQLVYEVVSSTSLSRVQVEGNSRTSTWQINPVCSQLLMRPNQWAALSQCHVLYSTCKTHREILLEAWRRYCADSEEQLCELIRNCTKHWRSLYWTWTALCCHLASKPCALDV